MRILSFDLGDFNRDSVWKLLDVQTGEIAEGQTCTTTKALTDLVVQQQPNLVLCEACTMSHLLSDAVRASGLPCEFRAANTNADAWRWKTTRHKTDRSDADKLIRLYRADSLPTVHIPDRLGREFRRIVQHRCRLVERRSAAYAALRSTCKRHQVKLANGDQAWSSAGLERIARLVEPVVNNPSITLRQNDVWLLEVSQLLDQIRLLNRQIDQIEAVIKEELAHRPESKRLMSAPGIGICLTSVILAYLGDPRRFRTGKQVAAYAGLVPQLRQSGKTERIGHITKAGNVRLRKLLINAAWIAVRHNPWARDQFHRLCGGSRAKSRRRIAIVAVARRLLVRCWAMLRDETTWRNQGTAAQTA